MNNPSESSPVILLTGASGGIGREIASLLAARGYRVFGASRRPEKAEPIPGVRMVALDLQDADSIRACVEEVRSRARRIDCLINNAGQVGPGAASEETDIQRVRDLFETNFFGIVQIINAVLPEMRARRGGLILNISSATGLVALPPFFAFYASSKHALEAYTEGLRHELAPLGIRVAMVEPGFTSTGIGGAIQRPDHPIADYEAQRTAATLMNRAGIQYGDPPEAVARQVLRVVEARWPALRNLCGADSLSIVLAKRFLPAPLFEQLGRWMFTGWKPAPSLEEDGIPTPRQLGLRRLLFHSPTYHRLLRGSAALALLLALGLFQNRRK